MAEDKNIHYATGTFEEQVRMGFRRLSWGAILAGLFVTLAIYLTLNLLGVGIGISTLDFKSGEDSATGLGIGAGIWWFLSGLLSLFIGGWVAGWLANVIHTWDRSLHGVVVWALMYLMMFWLLTTALASIVGGAASLLTKGVSAAAQSAQQDGGGGIMETAKQTLQQYGIDPEMLKQDIKQAVGPNTPEKEQGNLTQATQDYFKGERTEADRQKLADAISQKTGKSSEEAHKMIREWEQKAQQAKQKAQEAGETAATATGTTAIIMAIIMLLGLIAAAVGAAVAKGPYYSEFATHKH